MTARRWWLPAALAAAVIAQAWRGGVAGPVVTSTAPEIAAPAGVEPARAAAGAASAAADDVGPCPRHDAPPVLRRGVDGDGWPTWWHADGSITKRVQQRVGDRTLPATLTLRPHRR